MNYPTLKDGSRNWCATCKHNGEECEYGEECFYQENADGTYNHDLKPTHYDDKPQTNYDLLRQMSVEELAEYLSDIAGWLSEYEGKAHALLKWLKAPVEEGAG